MNKFIKLFFVALFAALSFSLTSCGDDDEDAPDGALTGTWRWTYNDPDDGYCTTTLEFKSNNRCVVTETFGNYPEDNYSIEVNYSVSGNVNDTARLRMWGKTVDDDWNDGTCVINVTGDKMTMYNDDDDIVVFTRIK